MVTVDFFDVSVFLAGRSAARMVPGFRARHIIMSARHRDHARGLSILGVPVVFDDRFDDLALALTATGFAAVKSVYVVPAFDARFHCGFDFLVGDAVAVTDVHNRLANLDFLSFYRANDYQS